MGWTLNSTVISFFAIIILTVLAALYRSGHEELVGGVDDPADGKAVSGTVFTAVFVYIVRLTFDPIRILPTSSKLYATRSSTFFFLIMLFMSRASLCFVACKECSTFGRAEGARFLCKADYTM